MHSTDCLKDDEARFTEEILSSHGKHFFFGTSQNSNAFVPHDSLCNLARIIDKMRDFDDCIEIAWKTVVTEGCNLLYVTYCTFFVAYWCDRCSVHCIRFDKSYSLASMMRERLIEVLNT